jgi:hypothetical protein
LKAETVTLQHETIEGRSRLELSEKGFLLAELDFEQAVQVWALLDAVLSDSKKSSVKVKSVE